MKMFLTRIGFGSTAVITGDITQIDLPRGQKSGLVHVRHVLQNIEGIQFTHFSSRDVVRHPLVQKIVEAYAAFQGEMPADERAPRERGVAAGHDRPTTGDAPEADAGDGERHAR
jgi:phosphate starvation-inducible PhoH-like protein